MCVCVRERERERERESVSEWNRDRLLGLEVGGTDLMVSFVITGVEPLGFVTHSVSFIHMCIILFEIFGI